MFLLAQVFYIFSYKPLVNSIAAAIFHPDPTNYTYSNVKTPLSPTIVSRLPTKRYSLSDLRELEQQHLRAEQHALEEKLSEQASNGITQANQRYPHHKRLTSNSNKYFLALMSLMQTDDRMAMSVMCLLYGLIRNQGI